MNSKLIKAKVKLGIPLTSEEQAYWLLFIADADEAIAYIMEAQK